MGIITSQCCKNEDKSEKEKSISSKVLLENDSGSMKENSYDTNFILNAEKHSAIDSTAFISHRKVNYNTDTSLTSNTTYKRKVLFSNFICQRIFFSNELDKSNENLSLKKNIDFIKDEKHKDKELNMGITSNTEKESYIKNDKNMKDDNDEFLYNDLKIYIPEENREENSANISFDDSKHYFLIEDNIYKVKNNLPKTTSELNLSSHEKLLYVGIIDDAIILLSEIYIYDLYYSERSHRYFLNSEIKICQIDYMSLSHDDTILIIHLVPKIGKNFVIYHERLNEAAGCIASSGLVDSQSIFSSRKISVIYFNKDFEILNEIKRTTNFESYKDLMNDFLSEKLINKILLKSKKEKYKYANIKYKIFNHTDITKTDDIDLVYGDLLITSKEIYILEYTNQQFVIVKHINLKILDIFLNIENRYLYINYITNSILDKESIEIFSESYVSLYYLIRELKKNC